MDVDGDSEAIQHILNQVDFDQLFLTEPDPILALSELPIEGSLPSQPNGGVQNLLRSPHPGPIATTNSQGSSVFDNLGFNDEEKFIGGGPPVHLGHLPDSPPDSGSEPYSPPESKLDPQLAAFQQSLGHNAPLQASMTNNHINSVNPSLQQPLPNRTLIPGTKHQRQSSLPVSIPMGAHSALPKLSPSVQLSSVPRGNGDAPPNSSAALPQLSSIPVPTVMSTAPQNTVPAAVITTLQQSMLPNTHGQLPPVSHNVPPVPHSMGVSSVSGNIPQQSIAPQPVVPQLTEAPSVMQQFMNFLTGTPTSLSQVPMTETINSTMSRTDSFVGHVSKKRKHSLSPNSTLNENMVNALLQVKQEPVDTMSCPISIDGDTNLSSNVDGDYGLFDQPSGDGLPYTDTIYQCLKWQPYQTNKWHTLLDCNGQEVPAPSYKVEADKGFNFSIPDDSFVCQKKNHFQVTVHFGVSAQPKFVQTESGMKEVNSIFIHIHGIKVEALNSYIRVEQSQADRSKKPYVPIIIDIKMDNIVKATIGRLHFSETTSNNMRKKGKPNPDQRYFMVVVSVEAHCGNEQYIIASHVSERIIVRASNPGQFESDVDVNWQKGSVPDAIYHAGRVGINTERPDEALVVNGNLKVTGRVVQPSDERAKQDFQEVNSKEQLQNIGKLRIMRYKYIPAFAEQAGLPECDQIETGVIAQEVMQILPDAVQKTGTVDLGDGAKIEHFLVVNKDRIYMENVGAVKELVRLTDNLETRIDELEKMNQKLSKLKRVDSLKSNTSIAGTLSRNGSHTSKGSRGGGSKLGAKGKGDVGGWLSPRSMQFVIVALVLIMLFCCAAIATLYIIQNSQGNGQGAMNSTSKIETIGSMPSTTHKPTMKVSLPMQSTESLCTACDVYCCETIPNTGTIPFLASNPLLNSTYRQSNVYGIDNQVSESMTDESIPAVANNNQASSIPESMKQNTSNTGADPSTGTIRQSRRKRALKRRVRQASTPIVDVLSIVVDESKSLCSQHCSTPDCGTMCTAVGNGNFTYEISVGPLFPLRFAQLYLNTSTVSTVAFCSWTDGDMMCVGQQDIGVEGSDQRLTTGTAHMWNLPVGLFKNSSYVFRIMPPVTDASDHLSAESFCSLESSLLGSQFLEYRFNFARDVGQCS